MKRIQKILLLNYLFSLGLALLWVVLNENDVFELVGMLHTDANSDFMLTSVMEIITICSIPIALRLFKFGTIRETVRKDNSQLHSTFLAFSLVRLDMLLVPMLVKWLLFFSWPASLYFLRKNAVNRNTMICSSLKLSIFLADYATLGNHRQL